MHQIWYIDSLLCKGYGKLLLTLCGIPDGREVVRDISYLFVIFFVCFLFLLLSIRYQDIITQLIHFLQ